MSKALYSIQDKKQRNWKFRYNSPDPTTLRSTVLLVGDRKPKPEYKTQISFIPSKKWLVIHNIGFNKSSDDAKYGNSGLTSSIFSILLDECEPERVFAIQVENKSFFEHLGFQQKEVPSELRGSDSDYSISGQRLSQKMSHYSQNTLCVGRDSDLDEMIYLYF